MHSDKSLSRRRFIKGAVAAAVAASLPGGTANPYLSANEWQPMGYTHKTYALATEGMDGQRMAAALARSMMQTKERVIANTFDAMFGVNELHYGDSGEGARRSVGVEGSPDRI